MPPTRTDYISQKSLTGLTGQRIRIHDRHPCIMPPNAPPHFSLKCDQNWIASITLCPLKQDLIILTEFIKQFLKPVNLFQRCNRRHLATGRQDISTVAWCAIDTI